MQLKFLEFIFWSYVQKVPAFSTMVSMITLYNYCNSRALAQDTGPYPLTFN